MNKLHRQAMELKYEGLSYQEISKTLGGQLTEGTLKQYFSKDGNLYDDYNIFQAKENEDRARLAKETLKSSLKNASEALVTLLNKSLNNGDDRLALKVATEILDRGGIVTEKVVEVKKPSNPKEEYEKWANSLSDEELEEECRLAGLDPLQ